MAKYIKILILVLVSFSSIGQNKSGFTWIVGNNASYGRFDGTSSAPQVGSLFSTTSSAFPSIFDGGHSNICDSVTGDILFYCNGMVLFDTSESVMENGDSLVPELEYTFNSFPSSGLTQSSLILPKGVANEYYVFISGVSDSLFNLTWSNPNGNKAPFDILQYNVVDMNANTGLGQVIKKNVSLLHGKEMNKVMMQACKHSNGTDWWLLKQGEYNTNQIIRFLITKDSIYGPYIQNFPEPKFGFYDLTGQMAFSKDGTKFASVQGKSNKLFLSDFDRCTGELSNPKVIDIPIDSTTSFYWDSLGSFDSISTGVCFSSNNQFIYVSKLWNIYQYDLNEVDSSIAWFRVKHGVDTSFYAFEYYGALKLGVDNKIYIGKGGGGFKQFSVIDSPNNKGAACSFCRKCFRVDSALGGLNSPPNMPDYNLSASGQLCWPLGTNQFTYNELKIFPNPTNGIINIESEQLNRSENKISLIDVLGREVLQKRIKTNLGKIQFDCSLVTEGIYLLKCNEELNKVIIQH